MPRGTSKLAAAGFGLCLLLVVAEFLWSMWNFRSPDPLGSDAPPDVFSAARARAELVRLLGDESPHPSGSAANDLVRARLVERLTQLGLAPQVQDTIGCSGKWPVCARVQNVLARLDGTRASTVALMAHYDSRGYAPGAGDDGAAVAALLEIARILRDAPQSANTILFVFTDGEEPGMLGAEGFFANHAYAHDVGAVINIEGSGSSGPALLLRSGPRSGALVTAFRSVARYPIASSFSEELFKRMPNDTDLSVASRFDKPGVDIAFAGERNHYHTPRDTIANLSAASLQHQGDDVLPLVRALANADLTTDAPKFVYMTLTQSLWLAYSPKTGLLISILAVVALGFATWRRWQGLGHFTAALGIVALTIAMIVVLELVVLALADLLAGTRASWPADPWPWRLIIYSMPVVALALQRPLVRKVGFWNTLLAAWWLWAVCTLALAWYLPLASHLLLPAATGATVVIVVLAFAHPLDRPAFRCSAAVFNALLAGFLMLPMAYMGEITQGFNLAPVMFVPLTMLAVTLLPLLDRGRVKLPRWIASVAAITGIAWVHWAALYSEQLPQHINFTYVANAASGDASYLAWSFNPLPANVVAAMPFTKAASPTPWDREPLLVAPTSMVERAASAVERNTIAGSTHTLQLVPAPTTSWIEVVIPEKTPVSAIRMNGHPVAVDGWQPYNGYHVARFVAPPPSGVTFEIDATPDPIDAYVVDSSNSLPDSARVLTNARGRLGVPIHEGDRWVVYRPLEI
jgi:hypothetical protein